MYALLRNISKNLPLRDGRIDYTHAKISVVVTVFVAHKERILLLKRSAKVGSFKGHWATVTGYWDTFISARKKAQEELQEELSLRKERYTLKQGKHFRLTYDGHIWIIIPFLARCKTKPRIHLDWEHTAYRWILPEEMKEYKTLPKLDKSYRKAIQA
jgi:ADP-ribose pyrophosphatase YjhB (NUDIX family)